MLVSIRASTPPSPPSATGSWRTLRERPAPDMHLATRPANQAPDEQMRFSLRASSTERCWTGFEAATYDFTAGWQRKDPGTHYTLVMHLSPPVSGSCRAGGPTVERVMRPGSMDFIAMGYPAIWRDDAPGTVLNVRLSSAMMQSAARSTRRAPAISVAPALHINDPILRHLSWALVNEVERGETTDRLFAESVGDAVALQLLRLFAIAPPGPAGRLSRRQLNAVMTYIDAHLADDLSLATLAGVIGLSPSHFKALFKSATGVPVHRYVVRQRVDRAVSLLAKCRARPCDVAQQSGFAHQSHMTRCMRRVLGLTPAMVLREFWHEPAERTDA
jgi:AraC family transcriptional regulator